MPEEPTTPDAVQRMHHVFAAASAEDLDGVTADLAPNAVWAMDERAGTERRRCSSRRGPPEVPDVPGLCSSHSVVRAAPLGNFY